MGYTERTLFVSNRKKGRRRFISTAVLRSLKLVVLQLSFNSHGRFVVSFTSREQGRAAVPPAELKHPLLFESLASRRSTLQNLACLIILSAPLSVAGPAVAQVDAPPSPLPMNEVLSKALRPATQDQPQILLPSGTREDYRTADPRLSPVVAEGTINQYTVHDGCTPHCLLALCIRTHRCPYHLLSKGLVYYKDPLEERPYSTDTLLITVTYGPTSSQTDSPDVTTEPIVLAGAKLPLNQVSLPLRFQLKTENLLPKGDSKANIAQLLAENDLIVQAILCSEETVQRNPSGRDLVDACRHEQRTARRSMQATAVAKLLRLPQLSQPIRAPVSLPLEWH